VLRRLTECLGRDRTKHQVTEITSLGLVQMTRKRIGAGLLEAFSETCEACKGRGLIIHTEPVPARSSGSGSGSGAADKVKAVAAASRAEPAASNGASFSVAGGRRRGRKGAAAAPASPEASATAEPAAPVYEDDTMGYDLSRYENSLEDDDPIVTEPVEPLRLASPDDPDGLDDEDDGEEAGAGSGGRRRSRRGGARRRTRP
jgi:ribonuclease E